MEEHHEGEALIVRWLSASTAGMTSTGKMDFPTTRKTTNLITAKNSGGRESRNVWQLSILRRSICLAGESMISPRFASYMARSGFILPREGFCLGNKGWMADG